MMASNTVNVGMARQALGLPVEPTAPTTHIPEGPIEINTGSPNVDPSAISQGVLPSVPGSADKAYAGTASQGAISGGKMPLPMASWAKYAGALGAGLTVTISAASIRRGGREPNRPDDGDVEMLEKAIQTGLEWRFRDANIPWWLGMALATGGVYATMRIGAKKVDPNGQLQPDQPQQAQPVTSEQRQEPQGFTLPKPRKRDGNN